MHCTTMDEAPTILEPVGGGRFGSYFEYTIETGKPLSVNYPLWLQEGLMPPKAVADLANHFVSPLPGMLSEAP